MLGGNLENESEVTLHAKIFTGPKKCKKWDDEVWGVIDQLQASGHVINYEGFDETGEVFCVTVKICEEVRAILAKTDIIFSITPQFGRFHGIPPQNKQL
ncbi:MAG: hypothetical protein WC843_05840 [Candidatus Gracilibacteria bacterium]|jgi:hypothetical protein